MKKNKYGWLDCLHNYRFHSIFFKNLALIFCVVLIPFVAIFAISVYTYNELQMSEEKAYTEEISTRIFIDLENLFAEAREKAVLLGHNEEVKMFFLADADNDDRFYNLKSINDFIALFSISSDVISDVYLYAPYSNGVISSMGRTSYDDFFDKECLNAWDDTGGTFQLAYLDKKTDGTRNEVLSLYYVVKYHAVRKGVVIINLNVGKLKQLLDYGNHIRLEILGKEQVLYDSTGIYNGAAIEDAGEFLLTSESEITVSKAVEPLGIRFIAHISSESLYAKLGSIKLFLLIFIGAVILLSILFVFYISRKLFDPISDILRILESSSGLREEEILENKNEVGYIRDTIYATVSRNIDIEEELNVRIRLLKKAQAVALQAQINPHFVNNTLENINWMAIKCLGAGNDMSEMLNSLSQILRFSLQDTDTFVTLKEEIEYAEKYLFIQLKRLDNQFDVVWDIPDELLKCKVIKLILQPVIENAINYGIKPYDSKGELWIEAFRTQDEICICVRDSGLGLDEQEADEINRSIRKQVIKESDHIGLSNVNQRIVLAFGEQYGVTVKSKPNEGTTVELVLPYQV